MNFEKNIELLPKKTVKIPFDLQEELEYIDLRLEEESENYFYDAINEIRNYPLSETFQETLYKFLKKYDIKENEIYKKAFLHRQLFSKIRNKEGYHPSFGTVTLLALALNLTTEEYEKLLHSASYSLSTNSRSGITLKYCFDHKIYDIIDANNLFYTVTEKEIKDL